MKTCITTATVNGKTVLVAGTEVPADKQRAAFNGTPPKGATVVQLWSSTGETKTRKFATEKPAAAK